MRKGFVIAAVILMGLGLLFSALSDSRKESLCDVIIAKFWPATDCDCGAHED